MNWIAGYANATRARRRRTLRSRRQLPLRTVLIFVHSFSTAPRFASSLTELSTVAVLDDGRFPARNSRYETTLADERVVSYLPTGDLDLGSGAPEQLLDAWNAHHDAYLSANVRHGYRGDPFDVTDPAAPETFRVRHGLDEFGHLDSGLDLLRVEDLGRIARDTGERAGELATLVEEVGRHRRNGTASPGASDLDDILELWQHTGGLDNRPLYAGFWDEAATLLGNPLGTWADELRDRLGLAHYDPGTRLRRSGIDIVVFRYEAALVPRVPRLSVRFAARPTVLDGALSPAFCTSPVGSGRGSALDLGGRGEDPWQEIVHPAVTFAARHVWAAGTIRSGVTTPFSSKRGLHYAALCIDGPPWFETMVEDVDGDLL